MPDLGAFHPQVVHFAIALLFVGVGARVVSLTGRLTFTRSLAATLLLLGTAAAVAAVQTGTDAHGPVERIPGARAAVIAHEEHGKTARNVFLAVAAIELVGLALSRRRDGWAALRATYALSALVGLYGAFELFEAGEHGGELVYSYAGGPGLRTGDTADVGRLLVAGLYNEAMVERRAGRGAEAAALIDELARRRPADTTVQFLRVESMLVDRKDAAAARAALDSLDIPATDTRQRTRRAMLLADAHVALGHPDSARAVLSEAIAAAPQNGRLKAKLDSIH